MTRVHRLEYEFADLAAAVANATRDERARIAAAVAIAAVQDTASDDATVLEAIGSLAGGDSASQELCDRVEQAVARLDEERWEVENGLAGPQAHKGRDSFRRARAASAVWFALGEPDAAATQDAVYEAHLALADQQALRALVAAEIGRRE